MGGFFVSTFFVQIARMKSFDCMNFDVAQSVQNQHFGRFDGRSQRKRHVLGGHKGILVSLESLLFMGFVLSMEFGLFFSRRPHGFGLFCNKQLM